MNEPGVDHVRNTGFVYSPVTMAKDVVKQIAEGNADCIRTLGGSRLETNDPKVDSAMEFDIGAHCCHSSGRIIQGGFISAMMDVVMAGAVSARSETPVFSATLEMKTSYLETAGQGKYRAQARVIRMGRSTAFAEAELFNDEGKLVATASSTIKPVPAEGNRP